MRRDLVYFYERPTDVVFNAFAQAAKEKFGKDSRLDPPKTINFALNFSFKYNMNGGAVTAHFMPYQNGTAVDLRYTIVQAFGARYKAHAQDLTNHVNQLLQTRGQLIRLDVNQFLVYEEATPSQELPAQQPIAEKAPVQPQAPVQSQPPVQEPTPAAPPKPVNPDQCSSCGRVNLPGSKFCAGCGTKLGIDAAARFCQNCGTPLGEGDMFCVNCGTKAN